MDKSISCGHEKNELISRQEAIEPLTDKEQRIFLAAMGEKKRYVRK